ncbi:MAG: hypothetical protein H6662_15700 [Ardenticatenaceae bacterium]|nr:hypothetical protein [Anaerolineales bacterium]MCB8923032.1 hypothetical protein [Ardenticatenaceae bacterium]
MAHKILSKTEAFFDKLFETIGNIALALIRRLAPFAVPAAPAYFLSHAVASAAGQLEAGWIGLVVGGIAALGLESAGILGAHLAVKFYVAGDAKWRIAAGATAVYLVIGIGTIWILDGADADAKAVGTAMFLIAGIVYLLLGLGESSRTQDDTAVQERHEASQHDLEKLKLRLAHKEELARIQAEASTEPAQSQHKAAPASYTCPQCQRPFGSMQAVNAHQRFCPGKEAA